MSVLDVIVGMGKREVYINVDGMVFTLNALGELTLVSPIADQVPVGTSLVWESEVLPGSGEWQWREGASLLRANYPVLFSRYYVNRGAVTITEANPGVVTLAGHGFLTGACISLATTGVLPTNLAIDTNYFVIYVNANTFRLASSADLARAGTAIDTTGAIQAGVHTLYSNPHGINGPNSFYLPDGDGLVLRQTGDLTINGRTKTGVGLGAVEEDRFQGHWHAVAGLTSPQTHGSSGGTILTKTMVNGYTAATSTYIADSVPNGTPRVGPYVKVNDMGVRYIVRVI